MKILMFATGMGLGGAETQICCLAKEMQSRGHELHIAWLTGEADVEIPAGVTSYPFRIRKSPIGLIEAIFKLQRLIRTLEPDVIHAHMVHANLVARITRLVTPIKRLVCTAHSSNEGGFLLMRAYRITDHLSDVTTHVSEDAANLYVQKNIVNSDRMLTIGNGIDTEVFAPNPAARVEIREKLDLTDKLVVITIGRLEKPKNHASLIRAFALIVAQRSDIRLVIVGDGSLRSELEALAQDLNVVDKVKFLGMRRDVPALLNAADLFVLSSIFEGSPLVLAEALATGLPVVATDVSGVKQLLGDHGTVVPIDDDTALALGILSALKINGSTIRPQAAEARSKIQKHYSISVIARRWLDVYAGLEPNKHRPN